MRPPVPRRFAELARVPAELRAARGWVLVLAAAALAALAAVAPWRAPVWPEAVARAGLALSLVAYFTASLLDLAEHFRLEREVSGRWLSWQAIPLGESGVHLAVTGVLIGAAALARPLPPEPVLRDAFVLASPLLFLGLGWWDELAYHRRRALHREDILHTLSHLAAGALLAFVLIGSSAPWHLR